MSRRRFAVDRGGARLAVRDSGGARLPIVLTHGLGGSALAFKRVTPLLTDTFRVITYDIRGHGASSRSDDYSWAALAAASTGADRIAELAPGIEVRWLATGHHM
jgi:pimeloyl-ACP methyl ester carboxylesterase